MVIRYGFNGGQEIVAARMTLVHIIIFILVSSFIASDKGDAAPHRACLLHPSFVVGKVKDVEWNLAGEEDHR
jgi:hypothetical protein